MNDNNDMRDMNSITKKLYDYRSIMVDKIIVKQKLNIKESDKEYLIKKYSYLELQGIMKNEKDIFLDEQSIYSKNENILFNLYDMYGDITQIQDNFYEIRDYFAKHDEEDVINILDEIVEFEFDKDMKLLNKSFMNDPEYLMYNVTMLNAYFKINPIDLGSSCFLEYSNEVPVINDFLTLQKYIQVTNKSIVNVLANAQRTTIASNSFKDPEQKNGRSR